MKKARYYRFIDSHIDGEKIPRKAKKAIFGKRISKKKLREKIASVRYYEDGVPIHPFCPKCGCNMETGTGNMVEYPEHWENFHCVKCRAFVGSIDNGPFVHVLDKDGYE